MDDLNDLYGIAFGCPRAQRTESCPMTEIENLSFKERVDWIDKLSMEMKTVIYLHHKLCTKKPITQDNEF